MDSNKALNGAVILIGLLILSNLIIYGIARGATRDGKGPSFIKVTQDLFRGPHKKEDDPMDELRKRVDVLKESKK